MQRRIRGQGLQQQRQHIHIKQAAIEHPSEKLVFLVLPVIPVLPVILIGGYTTTVAPAKPPPKPDQDWLAVF
jgi:nitrate reductase NapE component